MPGIFRSFTIGELTMFEADELQAILDLVRCDLDFYWETLKDEHETVAAALAEYDASPIVRVYVKLDAEGAASHREGTKSELELYLD
jgi:hypothetical protein